MNLCKLIISSTAFLLILSGCGTSTPKSPQEVKIDPSLPAVVLSKTGAVVDINAIAFEWKSIEDERVNGIYIYKDDMSKKKDGTLNGLQHHKTIQNRFTTHYVDTDINPDSRYIYSFKTYSKDAESRMSRVKTIHSLPVLRSVSWIQTIQNMPRSAKIIWRPHTNKKVQSYIVERNTLEDSEWKEIGDAQHRLNAEYIDTELKDNFVYRYRVRAVTFDDIVSTPSEIVKVVTKALPKSIVNIKASANLPKKIEIDWDKSDTEDFDRYYVYRSDRSDGIYEIIAKLYNNTFIDKIDADAKEYFYRVSAVEKNGLESIHDKLSIQGLTLVKPSKPNLKDVKLANGRVEVRWDSRDKRVKTYTVIKKIKSGWFDAKEEQITGIKGTKFIDEEVGPNITYSYRVYGIDKFGIESEVSIEIKLKTPKTLEDNTPKPKRKSASVAKNKNAKVEEVKILPTQDFN